MPPVRRVECGDYQTRVSCLPELWMDSARRVEEVITLGFFFVMWIGQAQVAMGPYADEVSCYEQAQMMEADGASVSACYQTLLPSPDSSVEMERDSSS